jgi:hypothetical protein
VKFANNEAEMILFAFLEVPKEKAAGNLLDTTAEEVLEVCTNNVNILIIYCKIISYLFYFFI